MRRFKDGQRCICSCHRVVARHRPCRHRTHHYDTPHDRETTSTASAAPGQHRQGRVAIAFVTRRRGRQQTRIEQFINKRSTVSIDVEAVAPGAR